MEIYKNTHAVFHIEGSISKEKGKDVILQPLSGTTIVISPTAKHYLWEY